MRIDRNAALRILEEETASTVATPEEWDDLVSQLSNECATGANKTFIAMLGTSLLAKATNLEVDPFALKSGLATRGAYSARSLCQHVLAANAPRLGIDLGVTGREPLNNQPFFAEDRVHNGMPVHSKARAGFEILMDGLQRISIFATEGEARGALRAFLHGRVENRYEGQLDLRAADALSTMDLISAVTRFVSSNSEYGRRAQASVAGILDASTSGEVRVSHVHDPDRHFPGDVNVRVEGSIAQAFEVRDKAVNEPDAYHFINKVSQSHIRRAAIVGVGALQSTLDEKALHEFASERSVNLQLFYSWQSLVVATSFWATAEVDWVMAAASIHKRALELEVSADGIREWEALVLEISTN